MKKWVSPIVGFAISAVAFGVSAETTIELSREISPLVLNGNQVEKGFFERIGHLEVKEGQNQLLVQLGQIVPQDGRRSKYNSDPIVIRFDAQESPLTLSYTPFRDMEEVRAFTQSLDFELIDEDGKAIHYQAELLPIGGLQGFQDYEKAVAQYNQKGQGTAVMAAAQSVSEQAIDKVSTSTSSNRIAILQTGFSELSAQEQQQFMQWAISNLK